MTPNWKVCFDNSSSIQKVHFQNASLSWMVRGQNRLRKIPQKCLVGCVGLKILLFKFQPKNESKTCPGGQVIKENSLSTNFWGLKSFITPTGGPSVTVKTPTWPFMNRHAGSRCLGPLGFGGVGWAE